LTCRVFLIIITIAIITTQGAHTHTHTDTKKEEGKKKPEKEKRNQKGKDNSKIDNQQRHKGARLIQEPKSPSPCGSNIREPDYLRH
jgi:hypothetical protein